MSDELLERLDAGPTDIRDWTRDCYVLSAARIRAQAQRIEELEEVANAAVERSGRGYDCLPDGWIAVPAAPFDALRRALRTDESKEESCPET